MGDPPDDYYLSQEDHEPPNLDTLASVCSSYFLPAIIVNNSRM